MTMSPMKSWITAALALALSGGLAAQEAFSTLEERMTGKEFKETGLHKLSEEELAALNAWLRARSVATLENARAPAAGAGTAAGAMASGEDARGFEQRESRERDRDRTPIVSQIDGAFSGWDGSTTFRLKNGMVWRQAEADTFHIREVQDPQVTIEPGAFGTWKLSVEGYGSDVKVKRVE